MNRRHLWVVEMLNPTGDEKPLGWLPCEAAFFTKRAAKKDAKEWRQNRVRIVKYGPVDKL